MANTTLSTDVRAVLEKASVAGNAIILPPGQLPRPIYDAVNKALMNAGGRWNKKAGGHAFTSDPSPRLAEMLGTGVAVDRKKAAQAFYTPWMLASRIAGDARVSGMRVLEPSAGRGALAIECRALGAATVLCVESDEESAAHLVKEGFSTHCADFLSLAPDPTFDRVVMNPPFTKNQDCRHVAHALKWLRLGGRLVSVMAGNVDRAPFQKLISGRLHEIEDIEAGAFAESGTNVATILLTIEN